MKREPFSWSDVTFTVYSVLLWLVASVGVALWPAVQYFVQRLKGRDTLLVIMGLVFGIALMIGRALADATWVLFAREYDVRRLYI